MSGPEQYGVSAAERSMLEAQAAGRLERRQRFLRLASDPRRFLGEGGPVFDPAMQRFTAMKATHYDHFKATPYTVRGGLWLLVFPMLALGYAVHYERSTRENSIRTGQVAYRDRQFKLI